MSFTDPTRSRLLIVKAGVSAFVAGLISSGHHLYGAIAYDTMWRAGVSYWILAIVSVMCALLYLYWRCADRPSGKVALWLFSFGAIVFQSGFAMFECVYSHVLKNILFFGGLSQDLLERIYPAPAYHLPDNLLFELSGLLQLASFASVWFAYRVYRGRPWASGDQDRTSP